MAEESAVEILRAVTRLETKLDGVLDTQDDQEERIRALESKGGKRWEALVSDIIKLCAAAAFGYLLAGGIAP